MRGFRLLYELTVERHIRHDRRLSLSDCQREGYCQRQMDVQWATRVAYNRA